MSALPHSSVNCFLEFLLRVDTEGSSRHFSEPDQQLALAEPPEIYDGITQATVGGVLNFN